MSNNTSKKDVADVVRQKTPQLASYSISKRHLLMLNDFCIVIFINIYKNVKTLNYSSLRDLD